ncbi:MAG: hypothetical protein PHV17_00820 [Candidatus Omnitrophica bacterium]|nr:hypothetical protein [Candidatus Omnitrophota bacterium]
MAVFEEIKDIKCNKKELRRFSLALSLAMSIWSFLFYLKGGDFFIYLFWLSFILLGLTFVFLNSLKPVFYLFKILAILITTFLTQLIIAFLFYLIITPIGLFFRVFRKKLLQLEPDKTMKSYWVLRKDKLFDRNSCKRQF